ncbi:IS6 family transposase, partial [uncultured Ruegeria sp.]|uniref:IS6 family transposase n=1 Tax=uncultured Ruegeria sp. TaxID=259304 RepID=UPI00261415E8
APAACPSRLQPAKCAHCLEPGSHHQPPNQPNHRGQGRRTFHDKWHMDEAVIIIRGRKHWLWRAIAANGEVLDILLQTRRSAKAAKRFFKRLVAKFGEPRVVVTDKLRSYIKPIKTLAPDADHRAQKGLNNAIEASHRPTRKQEKIMGRFKSHRQAQRFLSTRDQINLIFRPRRYQLNASSYRHARSDAFNLWNDYTAEMAA